MIRHFGRPLTMILGLLLCGCANNDMIPQADLDAAKDAVQASLDAWKSGEKPAALKAKSIEIFDPDWKAGLRFRDFAIQRAEGRQGKTLDKEIVYEVTGREKVIIGRDPMN